MEEGLRLVPSRVEGLPEGQAVRASFGQHAELGEILLHTGDAMIVEHTEKDAYWGDGGDGSGKNMLGRILMEVRDELPKLSERVEG
jgi:ribA/ribD-fused uncharacterized protein